MQVRGSLGFQLEGVEWAGTPWRRLRGLMFRRPRPLLLRTSMVHGFWLRSPLWAVGVTADGTVAAVAWLPRRRVIGFRGVEWVLELPPDELVPVPGERLAFRADRGEAGRHARTPLPLRDSHRQPG